MSVSQRTLRCQKYHDDREIIRDLLGGTKAMRALRTKYLPMEPGESPPSYKRRLDRSYLVNFFDRIVKNLAAKPFTRPVGIKSDTHQEFADEYSVNVDGKGTGATALGSTILEDAIRMGTSFLCADKAVNGGRPYLYHLPGERVLGFRMDEDDKLTEIRIKESAVVADGEWGEKEVTRVRVFKRDGEVVTWSLYDGEDGSPIALEQPFALKEIPVVAVHSSPVVASGELMAAPPLIDLAYGNVQHWQEKSDQLNILRVARIPVLFASGVADDASIAIGAEYAIKGDIGADLKYVEHSGAAIGAGRDSIRDLEMQMQSYGLDMLENTGVAETAQGRTLRAGETNNRVAMTTLNLSSAMSKGFGWLAYFNRLPDAEFHVDINTDYGVTSDAQVLSTLTTMRTMGDISREDYLQEMKRHSVLGNEFNLADNEDRLSVELA